MPDRAPAYRRLGHSGHTLVCFFVTALGLLAVLFGWGMTTDARDAERRADALRQRIELCAAAADGLDAWRRCVNTAIDQTGGDR